MEYTYVDKTKKRIKFSIVEVPYKKKKRVPRLSREEKLYNEAKKAKQSIISNKKILDIKMCDNRTKRVFESKEFNVIKNNGKSIRQIELLYYLLFTIVLCAFGLAIFLTSYFTRVYLMNFAIIPIFMVLKYFIRPKVRFKDLFYDIYLPVCYYCANVKNEKDILEFKIIDKKKNWNTVTVNEKVVTNKFKVMADNYIADIEKMIVRNYITTYTVKNGEIKVGKKLATIFSGYNFELSYDKLTENYGPDSVLLAIINKNTFSSNDGLFFEDSDMLESEQFSSALLDKDWMIYSRKDFNVDKRTLHEIQKKVVLINNEIGGFNAYITPSGIKMMISVQLNRDGLREEFFQAQLKNPEGLNFNGFFSVVKTLYIITCMHKLVKALFHIKPVQIKMIKNDDKLRKIEKRAPAFLKEKENQDNKQKNAGKEPLGSNKEKFKLFANKRGETNIEIAISIVLSVVLASVILLSYIFLIDENISKKTISRTNSSYSNTSNNDSYIQLIEPDVNISSSYSIEE